MGIHHALHIPGVICRQPVHRASANQIPIHRCESQTAARLVHARASRSSGPWQDIAAAGGQQLLLGYAACRSALEDIREGITRGIETAPAGFPPGPQGDSAPAMLRDPLAFLERVTQHHGTVVGLVLGGQRVVLVTDPAAARDVLIDRSTLFGKEGTAFFPNSSLAGNGLLVSDGEVWRRQRQLSNPAFRTAAVQAYAQEMVARAVRMVGRTWRAGGRRDVYGDFNDLTLQVTVGALFGTAIDRQQSRLVADSIATAFRFFAERTGGLTLPEWVPTPSNVAYGSAVEQLDSVVYSIIRQRRRQQAGGRSPEEAAGCLLDNLLAARDDDGRGMSDLRLRDELMTLLVAGQETAAILMAWVAAFLAHQPGWQEEAVAEVDRVLQGRPPTASDAGALPVLERVVLETLRLRPPAYIVGRCAAAPVTLAGFDLQQGTTVLVSPYIMHRSDATWDRPLSFEPERWREVQGRDGGGAVRAALAGMGHRGCYVPFGAGPRNCIGTGFAMMEVVLVTAVMLQAVRLEPLSGAAPPAPRPRITLRPEPFNLVLRQRTNH